MKRLFNSKIILSLITLIWLLFIIAHRSVYLSRYDINFWQQEFLKTQIVMGDKAPRFYSDTEIYAIVGYKYMRGENPTQIHPEVPPLGKELIGLSIDLFGNQNIINLLLGLSSLGLVYLIGREIIPGSLPSLLAVLLFSLDTEFQLLITDAYIDIPQLFFLLLTVLCFLKGLKNSRWFFLTAIFLGLMMATKFYFGGLLLLAVLLSFLFFYGNFRKFLFFLMALPLTLISYALPYFSSFLAGLTPIQFIHFQGWLTDWWAGNARVPWGGIFPLFFLGKWHTWWGKFAVLPVAEWTLLWPVISIAGLFAIIFIIKRKNFPAFLLWLWCVADLIFLSFTSPFPRYFVGISPFLALLTIYLVISFKSHEKIS